MIVLNFPRVSGPLCSPINPADREESLRQGAAAFAGIRATPGPIK